MPEQQRADQRADRRCPTPPASSVPPITAAEIAVEQDGVRARGSGWTDVVRDRLEHADEAGAAWLHRMKLRMMTRRTLMPASAAPRRLPPTATV